MVRPPAGGVRRKVRELKWPALGVVRRADTEGKPEFREPYPSHWAVNVRLEDPLHKRLRGGSRPGLTLWEDALAGETFEAALSVVSVDNEVVSPILAVISNGALGTIKASAYTAATGASPGASSFLASRSNSGYAISASGIVVLDVTANVAADLAATTGTVPTGTHGCFYRDRLVLGGSSNAVFMSRQGDPTDWGYGANVGDAGRPLVFQLGQASEIGDAATAFLPFQDASMLMATQRSLWLVNGDPAATGALQNLSRGVGIIGSRAWCAIQDARVGDASVKNAFVFLSTLGLFMISPSGDGLQSLSEDRVPEELIDIAGTTTVSLVYSPDERGVYVFLTPASGTATHWFFDLVHQGFWPLALQTTHQPLAACWHDGSVLLASQDGNIRSVGGSNDGGTAIDSYVLIGPVRVSGPDTFGLLSSIHGIIGTGSGTVSWRIIPGETAEEACSNGEAAIVAYQAGLTATAESYAKAAGTWVAGRSLIRYPRVRAMWMCVLLKASAPWAYESIVIESRDAGNWR